jgi:uncharacterized tellurite resistance protein B-like protein
MSTDELLHTLYYASVGYKREDQLRLVIFALLSKALESDDPRSGVWAELFKDLYADSSPVDWDKLREELIETARDALDDAVDLAIDNHKRGE